MKNKHIVNINIDKYKPLPISIFDDDYDSLENRTLQVIFNDLSEVERNLIIASVELETQSKLAEELNVSSATISIKLREIKNKIKSIIKEKYGIIT